MESKLRFIVTRLKKRGIKNTYVWVRYVDDEVDDYNTGDSSFVNAQARVSFNTALAGGQVEPADYGKSLYVITYRFSNSELQELVTVGHGNVGQR